MDIENGIGLDVILWFQSWRTDFINALFKPFDLMGTETFYLLLLTLVYWVIHKHAGQRLVIFFLFSAWLNAFVKEIFKRPRPYQVSGSVKPAFSASEYGLPSGHTQAGTTVGLILINEIKKHWATALLIVYIFLMGVSRMVHGVHFPQDVLLGWTLGMLIVFFLYRLDYRLSGILKEITVGTMWLLTLGTAVVVLGLPFLTHPTRDGLIAALTPGAVLVGVIPGLFLESKYVRFDTRGGILQKCLRYLVGIVTALVIKEGLKPLLGVVNDHTLFMDALVRIVRYVALGMWLAVGAPWLFIKLKLAKSEKLAL
jgi:membrane-associated phospholipid phosphatase